MENLMFSANNRCMLTYIHQMTIPHISIVLRITIGIFFDHLLLALKIMLHHYFAVTNISLVMISQKLMVLN